MPSKGLTLGKFAPLHRGHQFVIETGMAETDEMTVVIYDAPETNVPLPVRSSWISQLYPDVRLIEAWDGPTEVGYTPEIMEAHERYLIDALGLTGITHFFSSEPYGAHVSRALGAVDRRVDAARARYPISGTQLRARPFRWRQFVCDVVYRDLVVKVAFLGAPATGKTTLASTLASTFQTVWMPEFGREYWERHQVNRRLTLDQLVEIAEGHLEREDALTLRADGHLFVDTNAITTATFARYYHGTVPDRLRQLACEAARRYDVVFLCDTDVPYDDTWDRSGEAHRMAFQRQVVADLAMYRVPYFTVRGPIAQRVSQVQSVLVRYTKYANLAALAGSEP